MIGETIGNYRVLSLLGAGGMGEVFLAEHAAIETKVAIKVLQQHVSKDADQVQRFFNEARAVNKVRHAGTVKIFDVGFHKGHAYLVMEFLEGESLAARIRRLGTLDGEQVADVGRQIAGVLDAVHAAGITHRDLKPDNIFLVPDAEQPSGERVKVLDFGIAKLTGTMSGHSPQTRGTMGTPAYMAPEQWNNAASVDGRADTYSLGCVMFEMASGKPPFPAGSIGEACSHHLHTPAPRIGQIAPQVPPEFDTLLDRMLAKPAAQRPTLREVSQTFDHLRASGATLRWRAAAVAEAAAGAVPRTVPGSQPYVAPPGGSTPQLTPPVASSSYPPSSYPSQPYPAQPGGSAPHLTPPGSQPYPAQPGGSAPYLAPAPHPTTMPRGEAHAAAAGSGKKWLAIAGAGVVVAGGIAIAAVAGSSSSSDDPAVVKDGGVAAADAALAIADAAIAGGPLDAVAEPPASARERLLAVNPFHDVYGVRVLSRQVTAADYELVTGAPPPRGGDRDAAAAWVSQQEAAAFCAAIDARLPTSDEWAQAAKGAWGIAVGAVAGPLQEWTSTIQDELAVVRGGHAAMSRDALDRAAKRRPPYFLQKETGAGDRTAIAGATIGFRCVDGTTPPRVERPAPRGVAGKVGGGIGGGDVGPRGRPPRPTTRLGKANIAGSLPKEVIRRVIQRSLGRIQACYQAALANNPTLSGKVTVDFFITSSGDVGRTQVRGLAPVASCIARVFRAMKFPRPKGGGGVMVSYPVMLRPAGS